MGMYSDCTCPQHAEVWRQRHPWGACAEVWATGERAPGEQPRHAAAGRIRHQL